MRGVFGACKFGSFILYFMSFVVRVTLRLLVGGRQPDRDPPFGQSPTSQHGRNWSYRVPTGSPIGLLPRGLAAPEFVHMWGIRWC